MAKTLNFNNVQKQYLTVVLADDKNTTLLVGTPTKAVMDDLVRLQVSFETLNENETDVDATDDLYEACAKILSRNKAGVKITKEYLSEIFDFEDVLIFFSNYMEFVSEITNQKN